MGAQPGSRLVQLSTPRQKEFALRRENINECFFEFTIEPGEVVLFSHVDSSVSRAGILLRAKSQVGIHHDLFIPRSTENVTRCATCNPTSSRNLLELLADQRSQQQGVQHSLKETRRCCHVFGYQCRARPIVAPGPKAGAAFCVRARAPNHVASQSTPQTKCSTRVRLRR
jgi:hypothetical protein